MQTENGDCLWGNLDRRNRVFVRAWLPVLPEDIVPFTYIQTQ